MTYGICITDHTPCALHSSHATLQLHHVPHVLLGSVPHPPPLWVMLWHSLIRPPYVLALRRTPRVLFGSRVCVLLGSVVNGLRAHEGARAHGGEGWGPEHMGGDGIPQHMSDLC